MTGIIKHARRFVSCHFCTGKTYVVLQVYFSEVQMTTHEKHIPWYLWPFAVIWKLLTVIVELTGRLVAMILGIVLMLVGGIISLTVIGAIVGVPLAIVGLLLFLKGMF